MVRSTLGVVARSTLAILVELEKHVELGMFQASRLLLYDVPVVLPMDFLSFFCNLVLDYFAQNVSKRDFIEARYDVLLRMHLPSIVLAGSGVSPTR